MPHASSRPGVGRILAAAILVLGPLAGAGTSLAAVSNGEPGVKTVAEYAKHPGQVDLLITFDILSLLALPAVAIVALLAWQHSPKLAAWGGVLALMGTTTLVGLGILDFVIRAATHVPGGGDVVHRAAETAALALMLILSLLAHLVGLALLGAALWRSRVVPRWAAGAVIAYVPAYAATSLLSTQISGIAVLALVAGFAGCALQILRSGVAGPVPAPAENRAGATILSASLS
jgi:hypothetical protein